MGALDSFPTPSSCAQHPSCCAHNCNSYPTAQCHHPATSPSMMQPVPMAPFSPDAAAGHGTPASHGHVHNSACFSCNGAATSLPPTTNGWTFGWSPTASNYSPMHACAQPAHGMQAPMQTQPFQQAQQWQMVGAPVRWSGATPAAPPAADQHAEREASRPDGYSEADSDYSDDSSEIQVEGNDEGRDDAAPQQERARAARGSSADEIASVRAENERLRLELERQTWEMRRMSMQSPFPPAGTFGGSPFGAYGTPPPPHAPRAPRTEHFRPPNVLTGETPAPPATTGFHGLGSAIQALARSNKAPKLPWPDLSPKLMSNIQTKLPEDGVRTWLAVLHQHLEGACPGVKEFADMDVESVHALLQESSHAGNVIRSMNAWLARQIVPLLDMTEGTRSARLVKDMTSKAHNFLQSGWHVHDMIRHTAEPRLRANRVALRRKLKGSYFKATMSIEQVQDACTKLNDHWMQQEPRKRDDAFEMCEFILNKLPDELEDWRLEMSDRLDDAEAAGRPPPFTAKELYDMIATRICRRNEKLPKGKGLSLEAHAGAKGAGKGSGKGGGKGKGDGAPPAGSKKPKCAWCASPLHLAGRDCDKDACKFCGLKCCGALAPGGKCKTVHGLGDSLNACGKAMSDTRQLNASRAAAPR